MLQVYDHSIIENTGCLMAMTTTGGFVPQSTSGIFGGIYQSYPIYVCTDKTKKAIEVLKALQAENLLECKSVSKFIELVEKISNLL